MTAPPDRRPAWQREGREPDYRFSLANERTFLAWVRTALALLAGAVLFDQLATRSPGHSYVAVLAVVGGPCPFGPDMRDAGLQPERTAMAWTRTAISALVCAIVYLKMAFDGGSVVLGVAGAILLFGALGLVLVSMWRRVVLVDVERRAAPGAHLLLMTSATVLIGALAAVATAIL